MLASSTGGCMSLTVCCQWLEPRTKRDGSVVYENSVDEKLLQLGAFKNGKYSSEQIKQTYIHNVNELLKLVPKLNAANIKSFRMSSNVLPLFELFLLDFLESQGSCFLLHLVYRI